MARKFLLFSTSKRFLLKMKQLWAWYYFSKEFLRNTIFLLRLLNWLCYCTLYFSLWYLELYYCSLFLNRQWVKNKHHGKNNDEKKMNLESSKPSSEKLKFFGSHWNLIAHTYSAWKTISLPRLRRWVKYFFTLIFDPYFSLSEDFRRTSSSLKF